MDWQEIDTAPMDGTYIDLWAGGERIPDCAWWMPIDIRCPGKAFCVWDWDGYPRSVELLYGDIKAWMPKPSAPEWAE